jgi:hypothetical protein
MPYPKLVIQPKLDIGNDGDWAVASGPYDGIDIAGKALCLAVESYDRAVENTWIEARELLANVVRDSVCVDEAESRNDIDTLGIDHIELMVGIRELLEDWD